LNILRADSGSAVVMVIWIAVFAALAVGAVTMGITHNAEVVIRKRALTAALPGADSALERYAAALNTGDVGEHTNYQLTYGALIALPAVQELFANGTMTAQAISGPIVYSSATLPPSGASDSNPPVVDEDIDDSEVPDAQTGPINPGDAADTPDTDPPPPVDEDTPEPDETGDEVPTPIVDSDMGPFTIPAEPVDVIPNAPAPTGSLALPDELRTIVRRRGGSISDPPGNQTDFTVIQKLDDSTSPPTYLFWQVYRVDPPAVTGNADRIPVYFRSWTSTPEGTLTEPRYVRAIFIKPSFAKYQIVSEEEITLGDNARINANVHSNTRITNTGGGSVQCTGAARLSAPDFVSVPGACPTEVTDERVEFGAVQRTFQEILRANGKTPRAKVVSGNNTFRVHLHGSTVSIRGLDPVRRYPPVPIHTSGTAVLFDGADDVILSGSINAGLKVTIAARARASETNVRIVGANNFGTNNATIGIVSQGSIYLSDTFVEGCADVHAAMISEFGTLGIMPTWRADLWQKGTPYCARGVFAMKGSLAVRRTPAMYLEWAGKKAGYDQRNYNFDQNLITRPPPFFPRVSAWYLGQWAEADKFCLPINMSPTCTT
jgi:hypothetical protein